MSENVKIILEARNETGKEVCGRLRRQGCLPVVVYGPGMKEPLLAKTDAKAAEAYLVGDFKSCQYDVTLPCGTVKTCSIKSAAKNHGTDQLLHIDFYCAE
ncbi:MULTISPECIES: 50S ribosomal protein L25 [Jonquetella]|uniref:Ribosomal protein L25 (General stress protein Ctc) n=1 Tax=Jonquetella anthropi DSM 22815 TaxID=885272 RepID=H0UII4_9BACT|nr:MULTISPECIES: 50S ribosomal protein L25 [Jonquetella]EEX47738.1 hypothetical protein GCWU000246_01878 [Jonquetella anthropi E3_33 E1]EHM12692.1 ribosomal protein L25 (general stress protein Ctc) [Jonquetella anthropi DSM 22815]ERL24611.1 ribosomal L25p family protein [Jonquetella sp. BV3C21]